MLGPPRSNCSRRPMPCASWYSVITRTGRARPGLLWSVRQQRPFHARAVAFDGETIIEKELHDEAKLSYVSYAMSVMVGRALPDVRDGLKPVHRRILYAMQDLGLDYNKPFRKSARVVGEVLGKYHPHGDKSVYDALVRMAQPFSMGACLVDGHGNFGSIDKDPPAAMRYTECRIQRLTAEMLLADVNPAIVDFTPNFDGSCDEPSVLPARLPQLLINGAQGIAVGIATKIPPHNLLEVVAAMKLLVRDPDATNEDLLQHVKGPDFPTGAQIIPGPGLSSTYTAGSGSVVMRSSMHIETSKDKSARSSIIVTELPYQVYKAALIEEIAKLVEKGTVVGISDIQDESDRRGMRIAIELKRGANAQVVLNNLLKHSRLQVRFGANMVALVDSVPQQLTLREMLLEFINFRFQVVKRRAQQLLKQREARLHIVEGFRRAVADVDAVVKSIRAAADGPAARAALTDRWQLSDAQAEAVLNMSLRRLTGLAISELEKEYDTLTAEITNLRELIADKEKINSVMIQEADELAARYGIPRRTVIADEDLQEPSAPEAFIPDEKGVIVFSANGHIKRICDTSFATQRRGGVGKKGSRLREDDAIHSVIPVMAHDHLMCIASDGGLHTLRAFDVPERHRTASGSIIGELLPKLPPDASIAAIVPMRPQDSDERTLLLLTRQGKVKRIRMSECQRVRQGTSVISLQKRDKICYAAPCTDDDALMVACSSGKVATFALDCVRVSARTSRGVIAKKLGDGHHVVGACALRRGSIESASKERGPWACFVTSCGLGKRVSLSEFPLKARGTLGNYGIRLPKGSDLVALHVMSKSSGTDCLVATSGGMIVRIPLDDISVYGRAAKGLRIMRLQDDDQVQMMMPCRNEEPD